MSIKTLNLTPTLYDYYLKHALRDSEVLKECRNETKTMHGATMQISPEQGQFMMVMVELIGAKKAIDIGTFTGYSAMCVALALPIDGKVIACDVDKTSTDVAKKYWAKAGVAQKIELCLAPALETLENLVVSGAAGTFDLVFIDADKNHYPDYYEKSLQLLRVGGLMLIDNVLWSGKVADEANTDSTTKTLRDLNAVIVKDERVTMSMVPIGDGLTLVRKR